MSDCIVVGGGIAGLLAAWELAQAGMKVTVLDRQAVGREASWAGGGILAPLPPWRYPDAIWRLCALSQPLFQALNDELLQAGGVDPELTVAGMLVLDPGEADAGMAWARAQGVPARRLSRQEIAALVPAAAGEDEGVYLPTVGHIRNPRLLKALAAVLAQRGVRFVEGAEVSAIEVRGDRVSGVSTSHGFMAADRVVVAAGAWSGRLLHDLPFPPAVRPVRGQMLLFVAPPGLIKPILLQEGHYAVPRRDGRILVGSTMEDVGFDKSVTGDASELLHRAAAKMLPALAGSAAALHWAGLRPGSPGGLPYIGPHPGIRGLYANTGHFRNGVCTAPASAGLLADLMLGRTPRLDPEPYAWTERRTSADGVA